MGRVACRDFRGVCPGCDAAQVSTAQPEPMPADSLSTEPDIEGTHKRMTLH